MSALIHSLEESIEDIREIVDRAKDPITDDWDPLLLGLSIAKLEYENLDVQKSLEDFNRAIEGPLKEFPKDADLQEQTAFISKVFSVDLGFQGDSTNYYNVKNSFLSDVLVRRKGIPLTLSLVYMSLARAAGLNAVGIAFPGHFLVRPLSEKRRPAQDHWQKQWFVDPFEQGKIITVEDCRERLQTWTRNVIPFGPEALRVAHPTDIISRMLRNLRAIYAEKEELPRLYWVLTALIELCPLDRLDSLKERGFLFARMSRFRAAIKDLKEFLDQVPNPGDYDHVEQMLRYFELQQELMN